MKRNKKINKPEKAYLKIISKKVRLFMAFIFIVLILLIFRLGYIQFVKGSEYKEAAYNTQTINKIISPKRGTIYDSTGKALAMSADVDTITINPQSIKYKDGTKVEPEKIATAFSEIFELDYDSVYEKVTSTSTVETIIRKIEQPQVNLLNAWLTENKITSGVNIDSDVKRYYPYSNLASRTSRVLWR